MTERALHNADTQEARTLPDSTPVEPEMEDPEAYRLYRLCPCENCGGSGKVAIPSKIVRCKGCRGEGRKLELVATCGSKEAVGVALVTLAQEDEWDKCPFGLMHRPAWDSSPGRWLIKPWGPSPRNISDAGRTLARSKKPVTPS